MLNMDINFAKGKWFDLGSFGRGLVTVNGSLLYWILQRFIL